MTDPIAAPAAELTPAQPVPVALTPEIEKLIAAKAQELSDQRFSGYQSALDKKFSALQSQLTAVQKATLSPDEIEDQRQSDLQQQLAKAQRDNAMLRAAQKYPDAFPAFEELITADDPEAQLEILSRFLRPTPPPNAAPAPVADDPPPAPTPPVDPNNPPRQSEASTKKMVGGEEVEVTQSLIDRVMSSPWPSWR